MLPRRDERNKCAAGNKEALCITPSLMSGKARGECGFFALPRLPDIDFAQ